MATTTGTPSLEQSVQYLKGVGPRRAEAFAALGVRTVRDLLFHVPRRYEDASTVTPIGSLEVGMDATAIGEVVSKGVLPTRKGLRIFQAVLRDPSGMIECSWPGQPFLDRSISKGDVLLVTGPIRFFHGRQMQPREHVSLGARGATGGPGDGFGEGEGRVLPIYPSTSGLTQRLLRKVAARTLDEFGPLLRDEEPFSRRELDTVSAPPLDKAIELLHRPASLEEAERGRRRLAYGEQFFLQLLHARGHHLARSEREGTAFRRTGRLLKPLYSRLPFDLTEAQSRALREILGDMESERRMNRLLQGDVGSGKTVVALFAMLLAVESGRQAALMAPTEILAEQHVHTLRALLDGVPEVPLTLLTGRLGAEEDRRARREIRDGTASLIVGTHALIQETVDFQRLGLAVIDEQHRFGVRQRMTLARSGTAPDVLVMSATPIPRTLALTLYGDLDVSVLDELPPGRRPIRTALRGERARDSVYDFVRGQVREGRQAFIVYPLVDPSEKVDMRAATEEFERLGRDVFPELRLGLVHGQLRGAEKDDVMRAFSGGEIDILVATTVVEVGIDVPNATVMIVEHAERFGLSQLHQLRGRVGRGGEESYCILIASGGKEGRERLRVLAETNDGFEVARADLRIRGMGDFFGARQHGLPEFRFFDPERDLELLATARTHARSVIESDPDLAGKGKERFREILASRYGERARLFGVG